MPQEEIIIGNSLWPHISKEKATDKYLGIIIGKMSTLELNWDEVVVKFKKQLFKWERIDLPFFYTIYVYNRFLNSLFSFKNAQINNTRK